MNGWELTLKEQDQWGKNEQPEFYRGLCHGVAFGQKKLWEWETGACKEHRVGKRAYNISRRACPYCMAELREAMEG